MTGPGEPGTGGGRLDGRVALVTGAGGGIGRAICRRFAREGAAVAALDLDAERAAFGAGAARQAGGAAIEVVCDITSDAEAAAAVDACCAAFGRLTVLVNNAAADTPRASIVDLAPADWDRALAVNLTGAFLMSRHAIPRLREAGGGVVIHIASQLGDVATPGAAAYGATKAALRHLAKTMALDHAADGIRVVSLSPGAVLTDRLLRRYGTRDRVEAALVPKHPIGRLGSADEVAATAAFLASDDASFMTGADLLVDGGFTAQ